MAKEHSFDITAKIEIQIFKNAINLVEREVTNRYDFKGTTFEVTFNEKAKTLVPETYTTGYGVKGVE